MSQDASVLRFLSGTSYNVLVSALNNTRCPDAPCSEYGIKRKPAAPNFVYLPLNPNLNVESVDCNYMFGCQYKVTVETSNAMVRRSARVFVPREFLEILYMIIAIKALRKVKQ